MKQKVHDANDALNKKRAKVDDISRQATTLKRNVAEHQASIDQIKLFKQELTEDNEKEIALKNEIGSICKKYKKLLAEQKKERERVCQIVIQQRKILKNLQQR